MTLKNETIYTLNREAVIEDFDMESLIFLPGHRTLIKINAITRAILNLLDGQNSIQDITRKLISDYKVSFGVLVKDIETILTELAHRNVVRNTKLINQIKDLDHMEDTKYNINHDISCRIEEPEGAILFNPDTDAVHAINPIGLAIWKALEYPRKKSELVDHLMDICEDVPVEQVAEDVNQFIDTLKNAGFIGEVIE